ncbi:transducin/WD40 repeat protein [Senna tora]|uniref:Transducin/WD40 repeat protein n=1 Tax=Senna tora TaxID=362788 RepID=A0A834T9D7_9FABA|nr:transducin/WD40 repeat protein [Senna tora]
MASPPLQPAMLLGSPSYPNAIAWSQENLIAVASGHIVTILRPELPHGPRGIITVSDSEPLPIGVVERKDILSGGLLPVCLARDDKPSVRSISWSPLGMAANSGCLMAVCTTEGNVKVYRPPFCDYCAEWIEVLDITERMYEYLQFTQFGDLNIPSINQSQMQVAVQRSPGDMPYTLSRKKHKQSKGDFGNQLLLPAISEDGNSCSSPNNDMEGQRLNTVSEIVSSGLLVSSSDQSVPKSKAKSLEKISENHTLPLITADQYASRSAMLFSLVVSWSPLLYVTSEFHPVPNTNASVSLLAVGGKSGKISFWRFHEPDCYTIQDGNVRIAVKFVGLLQAHNSWVSSISWVLFTSYSSNSQILLATGSSDGSVKVWLANNDKLLKSSEVNESLFSLLKEVITVNVVPVSVLSATVPIQSSSEMLLAIGKGSGSFEIWLCDISCHKFHKLGSYDAHDHVVTGLVWAFNGRYLCSCSQDNLVRSWILRERCLDEVTISSDILNGSNPSRPSSDVYDSCFGAAVSPGNLVIATVHCFDIEKLNRMYEARVLRAAIEYFWIGGQQMDVLSTNPFQLESEEYPCFPNKELTFWESNIICSLMQFYCPDKPLVLWDIIAALLAFKEHESIYLEHILIKWLSTSFLGSHMDLPDEKVLSHIPSNLSDIPSRLLHLLNIICRRVMLAEMDADQINILNNQVLNTGGPCLSEEKQITKWVEILLSSERELRERLVSFSFSAFLTNTSYPEETPSRPGHWYPSGIAQMKQWVELDGDHTRDQLKMLASVVKDDKRFVSSEHIAAERCSFCSSSVHFESPEIGFCSGEGYRSGSGQRHRLLRCAVSMQLLVAMLKQFLSKLPWKSSKFDGEESHRDDSSRSSNSVAASPRVTGRANQSNIGSSSSRSNAPKRTSSSAIFPASIVSGKNKEREDKPVCEEDGEDGV